MKKLLFALTLVLCLAISMVAFTSCGGNGEGEGEACEHTWADAATTDKEATCTTEGSESIKCTKCGEKKADSVTAIPATGHSYDAGTTVDPTCTTDGSLTKTCATCNNKEVTPIAATGHTWATETTVITAPTCTAEGAKAIKCTACDEVKSESTEAIAATGHTWADEATVITAPTCTEAGAKAIKCTACDDLKPESTEAIAATGHTWADEATTDTEPTCVAPGSKSVKCTACNTIDPDTVEEIPSAGQHTWADNATIVTAPTLFAEGLKTGTCAVCNEAISEAIAKTETTGVTFTPDGQDVGVYKNVNIVNDVLKGDHFYPTEENPNGKGLYIEFSVLWNETLLDVYNGKARYAQLGTIGDMNGTEDGKRITPFFLVFNQTKDKEDFWCQYPGGFETDNNKTNTHGPKVESNLPADGYTYVGEYGWHRIGIEYTQVTEIEGETVTYTLHTALYVDGVKVLAYKVIYDGNIAKKGTENLLYTATVINDEVEYEDIASDRYAFIYRFGNDQKSETEDNAYFVVGDIFVTCGNGFVMNVEPDTTPTEGTYTTADGKTLDADVYYAPVCEHENAKATVTTVPTFFSEGEKSVTCPDCGKTFNETVDKTEATVHVVHNTLGGDYLIKEAEKLSDVLGEDQHFYPTEENPNGQSLYIEFSILLNESLGNFVNNNISFPGVYTNSVLSSDKGSSAFWFFLSNGDAPKGKCDDWTSNSIKELGYFNEQFALEFDGWHRIGVKFHQNTTVDYENLDITITTTVTMYYDGVKVYEATLGNGTKAETNEIRLYDAEFDAEGNVVYTDRVNSYAAYMSYDAYVKDASNPGHVIFADQYVTVGNDGFVMDVERVDNPEAQNFTQDDVNLPGKIYFELANDVA